jgi:aconitase B
MTSLTQALLAYATEFVAQEGAMDPDHGSIMAREVCDVYGTSEWYAELDHWGDGIVVTFVVYDEPIHQVDTVDKKIVTL